MYVVIDRPPNFEQIVAAFPKATDPGVIFAYGDTIYNPSGSIIPPELIAHEQAHGRQQRDWQAGVDIWWRQYIADLEFRYHEELYAHVAEMRATCVSDRNQRAHLLMHTARRLIAPLYNYGLTKTYNQALRDLSKVWEKQ